MTRLPTRPRAVPLGELARVFCLFVGVLAYTQRSPSELVPKLNWNITPSTTQQKQ